MLIKIEKLNKFYGNKFHALKDISFEVGKGDFLVVIGLSGSGKSTLLRCVNQLHSSTSGHIWFHDQDMTALKGKALRKTRQKMGMIFQHFNLIPRRSVLTNVLSGSLGKTGVFASIFGMYGKEAYEEALKYIEIVGLKGKEYKRVDQLSGGQKQRVAIARALMQKPEVLLADEPVASLDPATSYSVMDYLKKVNEELGVTIICSLHFLSLVRKYSSRVIALKDGDMVFSGGPSEIDDSWFKRIYGDQAQEVTIK